MEKKITNHCIQLKKKKKGRTHEEQNRNSDPMIPA